MWDKGSLHQTIEAKITDYQMIVVANREPYQHRYAGDERSNAYARPAAWPRRSTR